jgi:ferredoxin-NADP reductase
MISMLRYIDDRRLSTPVTLLYFARTRSDIIFATELERLEKSLPNFKYSVCLSRPDKDWTGNSGHLTEQHISRP